ncbi:MAG: transglycosylase domain-containing protein [Solirubrobacteraceae bacterium]
MSRRERQRRRKRNRGAPIKRALVLAAALSVAGIALGVAGVAGWVVNVADSAPDINQLKPRDPGQLSELYASDGSLLGYISSDVLRTYVQNAQIPRVLKNATIAIEDRRFYHHGGIDYQGILRAGVRDVFGGGGAIQGGSTLTMQLVRNIYLPYQLADTRSLKRKIIEAKLAEELEVKHSKSWILTNYLNDVDYGTLGGKTAVGVGAASQLYFDKPADKLDLAQAALLAGLPQAPSQYNPFLAPGLARARRHEVLRAMLQSHYITVRQYARADRSILQTRRNNAYTLKREPYVFDYVKESLIRRFGLKTVEKGGLKVYTTIDLKRQQEARQALLANEGSPGDPAAALVSIDPTNGHILAMATNSSYAQTNFDYATQARRQTGSAFKVFSLLTLIHDFHGDPNQTYYTSRELQPGWLPGYPTYHVQTSEHSYLGSISVTKATTLSDNTVFAQLAQDLGLDKVSATAHAMGITSPLSGFPSEALGAVGVSPLEMADAYATLASGGVHHDPTAISRVVFSDGSSQEIGTTAGRRVFTDGEASAATQVLKTVIQSGTGTAANFGCPAAGKTGTTSSYTDAYFDGYTPQLTTAVWVGYPKSTISMNDVNGLGPGFGGTLAAPIWRDYMTQASNGYCSDFPQPTTPFAGTAFFGRFAQTGGRYGKSYTTGSGSSGGTSGATATSPYTNPTLYASPPQPAPTTNGNGTAPPAGFGSGHQPSSGGAGIKHH